jgi:hypothetical protein
LLQTGSKTRLQEDEKNMPEINYLAVLAAAISAFLIGGLWYSPLLFGNAWLKANGFTQEQTQNFNKAKMFGWSFVFAIVMAINLAFFLSDAKTDFVWGLTAGALAGVGWVALSIAVIGLFENRSWKYILINGGYQAIAFTIMGGILGAWR